MSVYQNMKIEDLYKLRDNKVNHGNSKTQTEKDVYNLNNKNIRAAYGLTDADDVSLTQLDQYIAAAEKQQATNNQKNGLLTNLTKKAMEGDTQLQKTADDLRKFNYSPSKDPAYGAYVDMYNRQGQSAAKSTLNNLNATNMGRNSSYSAAATAQVQQAYAQKASEMIPTLAEQAYNKLLQRYNVEKDISDTQFNRELTAYQTLADEESRTLQNEANRLSNEASKLQLAALPEQIRQQLESGELANQLSSLQVEGMTYENRIAAVTAEIQEKYGLPMTEAEYVAKLLDNQKTRSKLYLQTTPQSQDIELPDYDRLNFYPDDTQNFDMGNTMNINGFWQVKKGNGVVPMTESNVVKGIENGTLKMVNGQLTWVE